MRITIDNLDGHGAVDYTDAVCAEGRLRIERKLNAPSRCTAELLAGMSGKPAPQRRARVVVTAEDDGAVLFTGYVATEPVRVVAGIASEGAVSRMRLTAISDEWLLDQQSRGAAGNTASLLAQDGASLLRRLANAADTSGAWVVSGSAQRSVGAFAGQAAQPWSVNAGQAASAAYANYRAVAGEVLVQPAGTVKHAITDADGTLDIKALSLSHVRELANDVTLSGALEPSAYITECFAGDGTTTEFTLSEPAFAASRRPVLEETFSAASLNKAVWQVSDPGSHFALTAAGLTINGGNGADGQTLLEAIDALELGGTLTVELGSVSLGAGSDGMLAGLYEGTFTLPSCFAGFRVRQNFSPTGSVTVLVPVLQGSEVGTAFTPQADHVYTLRLRLHCAEMHRVRQQYYAMVDGVVQGFGSGAGADGALSVVFDVVDQGVASNTPATVLYDSEKTSPVSGAPAKCSLVVVNAAQIFGAVGRVRVTRPGSVWVQSVLPGGERLTRLIGTAGEGADCAVTYGSATASGKVRFFTGRVPVAAERVEVHYRGRQRSVARLADAASVAAEARGGASGTCRWLGKVVQPEARSSEDCTAAAQALLAFATSRAAALSGSYATVNPAADVWPGDVLQMTSDGATTALLVRTVTVTDGGAVPEVKSYHLGLANDWAAEWADGLGLKLSESIAADALLPDAAGTASLASLPALTVMGVNATTLQLDAGADAPAGGGFEVRRRDAAFGAAGTDLALRSPVRGFSIPRAAAGERFYVRMYDGSSPPVYSRFSSAVVVNVPLS